MSACLGPSPSFVEQCHKGSRCCRSPRPQAPSSFKGRFLGSWVTATPECCSRGPTRFSFAEAFSLEMVGKASSKLDPLDRLRALAGKQMQVACEHLRDLSRARGGVRGGLVGRQDVEASLAHIGLDPPGELMDAVWARFGAPGEKVLIWKVLSKLPAARAGSELIRTFAYA